MNFISVLRRSRTCKKFVRFSPRSRKVRISLSKALVSKYFFVNLPSLLFTVFGLIWLNCIRTRFSCTNFVRSVIKELVHASSCANVVLLMHLRSLESTKEARVALGFVRQLLCYFRDLQTFRVHHFHYTCPFGRINVYDMFFFNHLPLVLNDFKLWENFARTTWRNTVMCFDLVHWFALRKISVLNSRSLLFWLSNHSSYWIPLEVSNDGLTSLGRVNGRTQNT